MQRKYVQAMKAGVTVGFVVSLIVALAIIASLAIRYLFPGNAQILALSGTLVTVMTWGSYVVEAFMMAAAGVLAVRLARPQLQSWEDALLPSALSGLAAGIAWAIMNIATGIITMLIVAIMTLTPPDGVQLVDYFEKLLPLAGLVVTIYSIICTPIIIVASIVSALVGGFIYGAAAIRDVR